VGLVIETPLWAIKGKNEKAKMKNKLIVFVHIISKIKKVKYLFFLSKNKQLTMVLFFDWL